MNNRRRFITLVPFAGATLLAACSKEAAPPAPAQPAPTPAPAPAMPAPAPAPSSTGAPAAGSGGNLPLVQESDPVAVGLGYVDVASRVDRAKYPNYAPGQACGNCSQYAGTASDPQAPCTLFAGKHVLASGWCSGYVKKPG